MFLNLLFYSVFVLFSVGQMGRISFFGQQINIYIYEICLVLTVFYLFFQYKLKPLKESYESFREIYLFFIWLLITFIIGLGFYKPFENIVGVFYLLRLIFYWIYWIYLSYWTNKNKENKPLISRSILLFTVLTAIFSVIQYLFYPDLRNQIYLGWDPHLYRLFGIFFDTSVSGAIYGLVFTFLIFGSEKIIRSNNLRFVFAGIYFLFAVLTFSRNVYLALLVEAIYAAVSKKLYKQVFMGGLVFLLILFIIPKPAGEGVNLKRIYTIESRIEDYKNAMKIWQKNPIIGIGYNRIRYEKIKTSIIEENGADVIHSGASFHSSFLIILVTSGVVGLILFLLALYKLSLISEFSKYGVIFLSILSLADNILLHPFILFLFFSLVALSLRGAETATKQSS